MTPPRINGLTFDTFQKTAVPQKTPLDSRELTFWTAGLGGEVGEFIDASLELNTLLLLAVAAGNINNVAKKIDRDLPEGATLDDLHAQALLEAGNVLFYLRQALAKLGFDLNEAATGELHRLDRMREAGTL